MAGTIPNGAVPAFGARPGLGPGAGPVPVFDPESLEGCLVEQYQVVRQIGQGGMGVVFEATHRTLGQRAAVKFLDPALGRDRQVSARFFNEARAASIVSHPGVVRILSYGRLQEDPNLAYILMEYLEGETLAARFERLGQRYDRQWVRLVRQVASAMAVVHEHGIIHRDLKMQNIMVVPDPEAPRGERIKILDFGVAKLRTEHYHPDITEVQTRLGSLLGTAIYMSPEQCAGKGNLSDRSDVYSLGAVFYRLLCGAPIFTDTDVITLVRKQVHEDPKPLAGLAPLLPKGLVQLVHSMLAKDPALRPNMLQVANVLEEWEPEDRLPSSMHQPTLEPRDETDVEMPKFSRSEIFEELPQPKSQPISKPTLRSDEINQSLPRGLLWSAVLLVFVSALAIATLVMRHLGR